MRIILRPERLITGTDAPPMEGWEVVVEGERIVDVVRQRTAEGDRVIDGRGCTLLPGLVDAHVHICQDPDPDPVAKHLAEDDALTTIRGVRNARLTLIGGITSIRTTGTKHGLDISVRNAIDRGLIPGPRIVAGGQAITTTGGHGSYIGVEADGPEGIRHAVRAQFKAGSGVIKLFVTGGVMTPGVRPGVPQFDLEEIQAAVREAKKHGRKVCAHAEGEEGVEAAIAAGVDSIEHGYFLHDPSSLERMRAKGVALVPTLVAYHLIAVSGEEAGIPGEAVEKTRYSMEWNQASFRMAVGAGVRIAMGSDAGTAFNDHGRNAREIAFMVELGMPPLAAIRAATAVGAELLGLLEVGTIEPGKLSDLLMVRGDPLMRIAALEDVHSVLKGGRVVVESGTPLI